MLFGGAGLSAAEPACSPGWWPLNDAILNALFARTRVINALPAGNQVELLTSLRDLRREQRYPPDYQADFLEEEAGLDYFRGLAQVDYDQPNPVHGFVADLAARGEIAAIVTTNFDRLFEVSLDRIGVPYTTAFDQDTFDLLARSIATTTTSGLPILKVHGTADRPASMIDTRKQRRRGRTRSLMVCLEHLLMRYPLVVAGFSGDDLQDDPDYLGFRAARDACPGLYWIAHPARDEQSMALKPCAAKLIEHYGPERATVDEVDASKRIAEWAGAELPPPDASARELARLRLAEKLATWAEGLDLCLATSMAAALSEAAGYRPIAHRLVRSAWNKGIDGASAIPAASRQRFLRAHARVRLRRGRYDDPELGQTIKMLMALEDPTAESINMFRHTMRRGPCDDLSDIADLLANVEPGQPSRKSDVADAGLLFGYAGTVTDLDTDCLPMLEECMSVAREDGDEVREALCALEVSLRITKAGLFPERSAELTAFASQVGSGIRDARIASGIALRHAFAHASQPEIAQRLVSDAFRAALSDELRLHMARAGLYWLRLAARHDLRFDLAWRAVAELNEEDLGPLASWKVLALAEYALRKGASDAGMNLELARTIAARCGLQWYAGEVERISKVAPPRQE